MAGKEKTNIVVAESSPVLLYGLVSCLRRLPNLHLNIFEIKSLKELHSTLKNETIDILLIDPAFGGVFNPTDLKDMSLNQEMKIMALETIKLHRQVLQFFDSSISITDDIETIGDKLKKLCASVTDEPEEKESLSTREKEIISLVVKGMTNQEIADKLFLSIHTVITHRRNIARKLEIHSATGLTIYAIVNKIVDISDIKL